jgi:hypothetical protein
MAFQSTSRDSIGRDEGLIRGFSYRMVIVESGLRLMGRSANQTSQLERESRSEDGVNGLMTTASGRASAGGSRPVRRTTGVLAVALLNAQPPQNLASVHAGQSKVEQDEVRLPVSIRLKAAGPSLTDSTSQSSIARVAVMRARIDGSSSTTRTCFTGPPSPAPARHRGQRPEARE